MTWLTGRYQVIGQAECWHDDRHGLMVAGDPDKHGLLVITDRQLVFLSKTPLSAWHIYQCPYRHIDRLDHSKGMIFGSISIWVDGLEEKFDKISSFAVGDWVRALEQKVGVR